MYQTKTSTRRHVESTSCRPAAPFLPLRNCVGFMCRPVSGPTIDTTEPRLVGHEELSAAQALWLDSILLALGLGNVEQAGPL